MKLLLQCIVDEVKFASKKMGLLILLFIGLPFLTIWFAGTYYNEYVDDVGVAVLDEDQSSLSRRIVGYFDESERFDVVYYASSRKELQQLIDEGKVYMGIYIPNHLDDYIKTGKSSQVLILTNGTNVVIGNNAYAGAAEIVQTASAGASIQVIQGKGSLSENSANNMALSFRFTDRMLYDPKLTYINYLMYGFVAVFFQQLMLSAMATLILRNPEETAQKNTGIRMLAKIIIAGTLLMGTGALAMSLMHFRMGVAYDGNVRLAIVLTVLFSIAISCPAIILSSIIKSKHRFSQITYMLSLPTFLTCGYAWPLHQMPKALVGIVKLVWPLIYFARPFDEAMIKNLSFTAAQKSLRGLVIYSVVMFPIALFVFKKQFKVKQDITEDKKVEMIQEHGMSV